MLKFRTNFSNETNLSKKSRRSTYQKEKISKPTQQSLNAQLQGIGRTPFQKLSLLLPDLS